MVEIGHVECVYIWKCPGWKIRNIQVVHFDFRLFLFLHSWQYFFLAPFLWISFSMWPTSCRYHALSCGLCLFCCNVTEGTHSSLFEATWKCDSFTYETLDWVRIFNSLQLFRCDRSPFYAEWTICSSYELCLIRPWTNIRIKSAASFDNVNCTVVDSQSRHTDSQHCVYAWVLMRCAEKERPLPSPTPND